MSKIYLPYASQFDLMNENLMRIASAIGADMDISTWAGIQKAVRAGIAPNLIPVGTQLSVSHSVYGDMLYDVVAHDHFKSAYDEGAHTMTLLCHDLLPSMQVDGREAFYYNDSPTDMAAGAYNFTIVTSYQNWLAGTYQFTLTKPIPVGGQLVINGLPSANLTTLSVSLYANATESAATESATITSGSSGTSLGTFGTELNNAGRCAYGSNNYKESAIRQFLNSTAEKGSVWTPQTKFDRPPDWVSSTAGFMNGLDEDFLSVVGEVSVPCSANNSYESPDSTVTIGSTHTLKDKFYLPSIVEITGTITNAVNDGSEQLAYYNNATATDFIKYRDGIAYNWRLRTSAKDGSSMVHRILSNGAISPSGAGDAYGLAPMCTIV